MLIKKHIDSLTGNVTIKTLLGVEQAIKYSTLTKYCTGGLFSELKVNLKDKNLDRKEEKCKCKKKKKKKSNAIWNLRFFRPCYWKFRKPFPSKVAVRILFLKNICSTNFNIIIKENLVKTVFPPLCGFPSLRTLISETYKNYTRIIWRFKTPVLTYVLLKLNLRNLV